VFGDVSVNDSNDVASRWEVLKREEKGRDSVTDGIAWQLPALTLYAKLLRKAQQVGLVIPNATDARDAAIGALGDLSFYDVAAHDSQSTSDVSVAWGYALCALLNAAQWSGVDLEGVLRQSAQRLADEIRGAESRDQA
jgi:uncharacterized protein YabN with tetrapyrrole methylase and pyrophosphatase domain